MTVQVHECKMGEEFSLVTMLLDSEHSAQAHVLTSSDFFLRFDGSLIQCSREMMRLVRTFEELRLILINPFHWIGEGGKPSNSTGAGLSDSDDSETDGAAARVSDNILSSFVNWFLLNSKENEQHLIIISHTKLPRGFPTSAVREERSLERNDISSPIIIANSVIPEDKGCIRIRGGLGSGKSSALFELGEKHPIVWLFVHEIVHCELGESSLIIRRLFTQASAQRPGIVVMDDADLILNTSGRIVKEIIEEIGNCISEFSPQVKFIFTMDRDATIDDFITSKVDMTIDL